MKWINSVLLVFLCAQTYGQTMLPVYYDTLKHDGAITVTGNGFYHTSSLHNQLGDRFVFGGTISEEAKDNSYRKMEEYNTLGGELGGEVTYYHGTSISEKYPNLSWKLTMGSTSIFGASYHRDVFGLLMYGNQRYLDDYANLSNTYGFYYSGTNVGVGVYNKKTKAAIALNAVMVNNYARVDLGQAQFGTNQDASEIFTVANGNIGWSDAGFYNGLGLAVDADYYLRVVLNKEKNRDGYVQFRLRNIGVARLEDWNNTTVGGTFNFSGFDFSSLSSENGNPSFVEQVKDSIGLKSTNKAHWVAIPGVIQVSKIIDKLSEKKLQSFFGVRTYITSVYRPMVFAGLHYNFIPSLAVGGQISHGGFGGFRTGVYLSYIKDNVTFNIGSEDFLGAVHSRQYGQSVMLGISWMF